MARKRPVVFRRVSRRLWRDERGAVLVLVALTATVLLAVTGLAVDVGWWYTVQRQEQAAVDAGAISAAFEVVNGNTDPATDLVPAANKAATDNRYSGATPIADCTATSTVSRVCYPYGGGEKLEVVLRQPQNTWFAAITGLSSVNIVTRAVAQVEDLSTACVYLTSDTGRALSVIGSASFSLPTCAVCSDSTASDSIYVQGGAGATLSADAIVTAGGWSSTGSALPTVNHPIQIGASGCDDPYASGLTHDFLTDGMPIIACLSLVSPFGGSCVHTSGGNQRTLNLDAVVLQPNTVFQGGLNVQNQTIDLMPGTYWIADGNLDLGANSVIRCSTCAVGGNGVTIILTTTQGSGGIVGNVKQGANATIESLNAPGSGDFQNLLLIQDSNGLPTGTTFTSPNPCTQSCTTFQGGAGHTLEGLFYMPNTDLTFQGSPVSQNGCLLIVADTLTIQGNGTTSSLATAGCPIGGPGGVVGGVPDPLKTVALVE